MESPFERNETELKALVDRFEEMLRANGSYFFDVEDFEDIIDYYLDNQDAARSKKAIDLAEAQHPGATGFMIKRAKYYVLANKSAKAINLLEEVEKIDPTNGEIYLLKGSIYSKLKKYDDAIREYNKAVLYASDLEEVYNNIAYEYENAGEYLKAIEYLKKILELNPENEPAIFEIAFCYEVTNELEKAVEYFSSFLDKFPYSKVAWFNLGIAYNNLELFEKAIESYEFAIAIDETFSSAYFNLGNAYANLGEYHLSIKNYRETIKYEEPQAITYYYIGECFEKLGRYDEAIENYRLALDIDHEMSDAWMGMGVCYDELGDQKTAVKNMEKALEYEDDNSEYWYIYGDLKNKLFDRESAAKAYEKVSALDPMHPDIWLDLSEIYFQDGEIRKAFDVMEEGIFQQPLNASQHYRMAGMLMLTGKHKQGLAEFAQGLELDFQKHPELFEFSPELEYNAQIQELIQVHYRKK